MSSVSNVSTQLNANVLAQFEARKAQRFAKIDQNADGKVSKDEFVAGRPKHASEAQASALYDKIDSQKTNGLTQDQLDTGLKANRPSEPRRDGLSDKVLAALLQAVQQLQGNAKFGQAEKVGKEFDKIDSNADGKVTKDEFVAARPDDISTQDAEALFSSIDTEKSGTISKEQFIKSAETAPQDAQKPQKGEHAHGGGHGGGHGGPPPAKGGGESKSSSKTTTYEKEDLNKDGKVSDAEKLTAAITKAQEAAKEAAKAEAKKLALVANTVTSAYAAAQKTNASSSVQSIA